MTVSIFQDIHPYYNGLYAWESDNPESCGCSDGTGYFPARRLIESTIDLAAALNGEGISLQISLSCADAVTKTPC